MPSPAVPVAPDAIRIEDEVWNEAFTRREVAESRRPRRASAPVRPQAAPRPRAAAAPPLQAAAHLRPREAAAPRPRAAAPLRASAPASPARTPSAPRVEAPTAWIESGPPSTPSRAATPRVAAPTPPSGRRTVTIRGRGAERHLPWPGEARRRPARRPHERTGFRPDRVALWAVFLGMLLAAVAIASPHS